jgi:hypothetical protein
VPQFKDFPQSCDNLHWIAHKANLRHWKLLVFKEQCMEMCQHFYNTINVARNEANFSIARMVYTEVELRKEVDWRSIKL